MNKLYKYTGTGNSGTFSWLLQRISGVVIFITVLYHIIVKPGMERFIMGLVLAFGVWHAINGLKMITDDYVSCRFYRITLFCIYWVLGIMVLIMGLTLI